MQRLKATKQEDIDYIVVVLGCCAFISDTHGFESVAAEMAEIKLSSFTMTSIKAAANDSISLSSGFWAAFARQRR